MILRPTGLLNFHPLQLGEAVDIPGGRELRSSHFLQASRGYRERIRHTGTAELFFRAALLVAGVGTTGRAGAWFPLEPARPPTALLPVPKNQARNSCGICLAEDPALEPSSSLPRYE